MHPFTVWSTLIAISILAAPFALLAAVVALVLVARERRRGRVSS